MAEKVNGQGFGSVDATGNMRRLGRSERIGTPSSPTESRTASTDTVSLTPSALLLQRLEDILAEVPISDAERVSAIKQAVDSGAYEIDAHAIADALLRLETELA